MKSLTNSSKPLTAKQRAYCQARVSNFSHSAAYLKAGYKSETPDAAKKNSFALEQLPHVKAHLVQRGHQIKAAATNPRHNSHHGSQSKNNGAIPLKAKTGRASHSKDRAEISLPTSSAE